MLLFFSFSLNLEHPVGIVNATGRGGKTTKEQFFSTMPLRADIQVHKQVYKGRRWNWYSVILITEWVLRFFMRELKDFQRTVLCDRIEAAQSQGADAAHWSRPVLWLPQWSNYHMSCYHILSITNVSSRMHGLIFSPCLSIRVWLIRHLARERNTHPIDFFLVYIFTHTLMQLGAHLSMVSAPLGAMQSSPLQ